MNAFEAGFQDGARNYFWKKKKKQNKTKGKKSNFLAANLP